LTVQVAPAPQVVEHLPPAHVIRQVAPDPQSVLQAPPGQATSQVLPAAQFIVQPPGAAHPVVQWLAAKHD
jgi:hypothetical protein